MGYSNYLCGETMSSSLHESNSTSECQRKISTQMCFSSSLVWCAFVCVSVCTRTNVAVCVVGLSLNTQRPRELPRAERTASVCVLVPSKQGNLENTKGAANKHNLIPPSSYTWLWIMQRYSKDVCLFSVWLCVWLCVWCNAKARLTWPGGLPVCCCACVWVSV